MNPAIRVCAVKNSIMYIDTLYRCWIFITNDKAIVPVMLAGPISHYCEHGFGNYTGEEFRYIVDVAIDNLKVVVQFIRSTAHSQKLLPITSDITERHGFRNMTINSVYDPNIMPWYDKLCIHPILCHTGNEYSADLEVEMISYIEYYKNTIRYYTNSDMDYDIAIPLTDAEIDAVKFGPLTDDWYLHIGDKPVVCRRINIESDESDIYYLHHIGMYNPAKDSLITTYDMAAWLVRGIENMTMADIYPRTELRPLTDAEFDAFKIGYTS